MIIEISPTVIKWIIIIAAIIGVLIGSLDSLLHKDPSKKWRKWVIIPFSLVVGFVAYCTLPSQNNDSKDLGKQSINATTKIKDSSVITSVKQVTRPSLSENAIIHKKKYNNHTKPTNIDTIVPTAGNNNHTINGNDNKVGVNGDVHL
jgi:hypothetical protein